MQLNIRWLLTDEVEPLHLVHIYISILVESPHRLNLGLFVHLVFLDVTDCHKVWFGQCWSTWVMSM